MDEPAEVTGRVVSVEGFDLLIGAVLAIYLGHYLTRHLKILQRYSIPPAVTGGLFCCLGLWLVSRVSGIRFEFGLGFRDVLLLFFFSTIGLSAKLAQLKQGGKALLVLVACAAGLLVLQDLTGLVVAKLTGSNLTYGIMAGSVSLAGGHGTAIAWGKATQEAGLAQAEVVGIVMATFGLILGGVLGGPVAEGLIKRNKLSPPRRSHGGTGDDGGGAGGDSPRPLALTQSQFLLVLLLLAVCVEIGALVNRYLSAEGLRLPGFLTAMLVGIILTNLCETLKKPLPMEGLQRAGAVSLQLFLAMSLMALDLTIMGTAAVKLGLALLAQAVVITLFTVFVVFRAMGRDYDAAIISSGFIGLGLGATPVAVANMEAVTGKWGMSAKALLIVPLVGAFFLDLCNAIVIKFFIGISGLEM